ncbi:MAG: FAD-dependent oxidoreductase [Deltaproteobacteria bacterium]|nr:FAD-dependent oxidoreductase [Deltaproteobacteria bacterium]NIS77246.1 FAD-dependent oxidoreductase [Deltaproteobacteria bacterium]
MPGKKRKYVIIGAGVAGVAAALAIREQDGNASVTLVDEEADFPYYRFLLGDVILGTKDELGILIKGEDFFDEKGIRLRRGQKVLKLSVDGKYVFLSNNERLAYDAILISVGRREIIPAHLKKYSPWLSLFSSLEDTLKIKSLIPRAKRAVLRGKGFNALELARVLLRSGLEVALVTPDRRLNYPSLPEEENEQLRRLITDAGIILEEGEDINRIEKDGMDTYRVELLSGETMEAEIVFASGGFAPKVDFLHDSGVYLNQGVIVDDYMQSTSESVFAAGDCAEIYHPALKRYWVNLGYPNARTQGTVAGKNMAGELLIKLDIDKMKPYTIFGRELYARWWD